jgi:hypothetical protein
MKKFALVLVAVVGVLMMNSCSIFGIGQGITLYNYTSYDMLYVYITETSDSSWGYDQLGSSFLYSGSSYNFPTTYSEVDLRAESSLYYWALYNIPTAGPSYTAVYMTDTSIYRETEDGTVVTVAVKPTGSTATQTAKIQDRDGGAKTK